MTSLIPYEKSQPPEIPDDWEFLRADKAFDENIRNWRRLTEEVITTLWIFYNKLANPGKRVDLVPNGQRLPTWAEWLESKGIGIHTPTRHFKALGWLPSEEPEKRTTFYLTESRHNEIKDRVDRIVDLMTLSKHISLLPVSRIKLELKELKDQINGLTINMKGK